MSSVSVLTANRYTTPLGVSGAARGTFATVRRAWRILLNALSPLFLAFALATAALWVRSYRTADQIWTGAYLVESELGGLYLTPAASSVTLDSFPAGTLGVMEREWLDEVRRLRPVRFIPRRSFAAASWLVIVPHWFAALAFAALPSYRLARRVCRRRPPGHCPSCGYDLRATPERRPECGCQDATSGGPSLTA